MDSFFKAKEKSKGVLYHIVFHKTRMTLPYKMDNMWLLLVIFLSIFLSIYLSQNVSKLLDLDLIKVDLVSASILPTHGHHINILLITLIT